MLRRLARHRSISTRLVTLALASIPLLACPGSAGAAFHLNEVTKIMVGYNGDATIQAVELKMLANGENLVTGAAIKVYDKDAVLVGTLGTFAGSLPAGGALTGRKILCATSGFAATFGITPDLVISPGLAVGTGQVSFETATCLVNAIPYGGVVVYKNGTTAAPPILALEGVRVLLCKIEVQRQPRVRARRDPDRDTAARRPALARSVESETGARLEREALTIATRLIAGGAQLAELLLQSRQHELRIDGKGEQHLAQRLRLALVEPVLRGPVARQAEPARSGVCGGRLRLGQGCGRAGFHGCRIVFERS